jgi:hypothetical protein
MVNKESTISRTALKDFLKKARRYESLPGPISSSLKRAFIISFFITMFGGGLFAFLALFPFVNAQVINPIPTLIAIIDILAILSTIPLLITTKLLKKGGKFGNSQAFFVVMVGAINAIALTFIFVLAIIFAALGISLFILLMAHFLSERWD